MSNPLWVNYKASYKPKYQTDSAAGLDLQSDEDVSIQPGKWALVPTGLHLEIPTDHAGFICPRSGLAAKHGITVLNAPGVIDSDFRGEVKVILINHSSQEYSIKKGDRIAQIVFMSTPRAFFLSKEDLTKTERGGAGFGSTGV